MSENLTKKNRCVDIVFCIDGTGSMGNCIETVKSNAKEFYRLLLEKLVEKGSEIDETRIKVIVFRDYEFDGENSMQISEFFQLPQDEADYESFLSGVRPFGGGDAHENGLEALYYAMQSKFVGGDDDRQIIVLFTDTDALAPGERSSCEGYPADMVDLNGLNRMWCGLDQERDLYLNQYTKRLVLFAPEKTQYEQLKAMWNLVWYMPVVDGRGLEEISLDNIVDLIAASATAKTKKTKV